MIYQNLYIISILTCLSAPTNHGLHDAFRHPGELLINLDGKVTQNLSILRKVKILQAVFILLGTVLCHKRLREEATESVVIHVKMWSIELALLFAAEIFSGRDKISNEQTCKENKQM